MKCLYLYDGHIYEFVTDCKMKHPDTGEWIPAVIYSRDGVSYCRETSDFIVKFNKIDL